VVRDVTFIVAFTANVVTKAVQYVTRRQINTELSWANANGQAATVASAIRPRVIGGRAPLGYRIYFRYQ
jgi:hypothetical protein